MRRYLQPGDRVVAQAYLLYAGAGEGMPVYDLAGLAPDDDVTIFDEGTGAWLDVLTDAEGRLYVEA